MIHNVNIFNKYIKRSHLLNLRFSLRNSTHITHKKFFKTNYTKYYIVRIIETFHIQTTFRLEMRNFKNFTCLWSKEQTQKAEAKHLKKYDSVNTTNETEICTEILKTMNYEIYVRNDRLFILMMILLWIRLWKCIVENGFGELKDTFRLRGKKVSIEFPL